MKTEREDNQESVWVVFESKMELWRDLDKKVELLTQQTFRSKPRIKIMKKKPSNPPKSWARQTLEKSGRSNSSPSWTNSLVGTGSFFVSTWFRMLFQEPLCLNSHQSSELLLTLKLWEWVQCSFTHIKFFPFFKIR